MATYPPVEPAFRNKKIFCFGFGYTASFLAERLMPFDWSISGTTTDHDKKAFLKQNGIESWLFDRHHGIPDPYSILEDVTHVLLSVPPDGEGDPAFDMHGPDIAAMKNLEWVGYLSSTGVYGNQDGHWTDETTQTTPDSRRGSLRLKAEQQWQSLCFNEGVPLHIFRLAGIYGPGRSAIDSIRSGTARRINKIGHVFNRVHVDDIVQTLVASMNNPSPGAIYNVADDMPSPSHEVISFACNLLGVEPPPMIPFDQADMAPMVRSFYKDNKRIKNDKIKDELGVHLIYPDYRHGLQACLDIEGTTSELLRASSQDGGGS